MVDVKFIAPVFENFLHTCLSFFGALEWIDVGDTQLLKFLSRVSKLTMGRFIEFNEIPLGIDD
jgi:hypothetical protein